MAPHGPAGATPHGIRRPKTPHGIRWQNACGAPYWQFPSLAFGFTRTKCPVLEASTKKSHPCRTGQNKTCHIHQSQTISPRPAFASPSAPVRPCKRSPWRKSELYTLQPPSVPRGRRRPTRLPLPPSIPEKQNKGMGRLRTGTSGCVSTEECQLTA